MNQAPSMETRHYESLGPSLATVAAALESKTARNLRVNVAAIEDCYISVEGALAQSPAGRGYCHMSGARIRRAYADRHAAAWLS